MKTVCHRRMSTLAWIFLGLAVLVCTPARSAETNATLVQQSESRLKRDVTYLASDECEGRGPTTRGINLAADYIANEFKKAGLKPAGKDGSYFQPFSIAGAIQEGTPKLILKGPRGQIIELKQGLHFDAMGLGSAGKVTDAPVAFAGYGIAREPLPDEKEPVRYDDYANLDVQGKVVVVLRDVPRVHDKNVASKLKPRAPFVNKINLAHKKQARAVLFVNDAGFAAAGDDLYDFNYTALGQEHGKLPAIHMKRSVLEMMLRSEAEDLGDLEKRIDSEFQPLSLDLTGWKVSLEVGLKESRVPLKNVAGILEGKGPLAKETVVVGAHYDHLGYGGAGGSLDPSRRMKIRHGADDNGSGSTAIMELARRFAAMPERQGRRMLFITFSGEELGLLGSKHYCKEPLIPLEDTVAMFNLDMVGRLSPDKKTHKQKLLVEGSNTAKVFGEILDTLNKEYHFHLVQAEELPRNSDHYSFYEKKVPVLFLWTGVHADYHRPTDTADKINVAGMWSIVNLSQDILVQLTTMAQRPEYIKVKIARSIGSRSDAPRLGIAPDYAYEGKDGVMVDGTSEGMPAARAGMQKGDRIVELAGKPVRTLQEYMQVMTTQKKGETIEVGIVREGKPMTVKVKLE